jgi:hypothetical protein
VKEDSEGLGFFFSFLNKSVSGLLCIGNFQEDGGNNLSFQE